MRYRVKIKNPNKMFIVNNKQVRSPFQCFINEEQLILIRTRIKFYGLLERDYEIEPINPEIEQQEDYSLLQPKREPVKTIRKENIVIKKQEQANKDFNDAIKPKQKILVKEDEKLKKPRKNIKTTGIELSGDLEETTEQILNSEDKIENESDIEVKIEELTIESTSILEKFLQREF